MKSLLPIISITFLSRTLTNFSSSVKKTEVEDIASRLEDSIVGGPVYVVISQYK
ncbi:MAG: hypothetical protein O4804_05440 [Trichodesmium sp. St11_bin5]|nr:hypothetical protein [Trichodesmium sp. St11_bin5]